MDHRVTVTICGNEYTFVAEEDGAYVEKVAAYVDQKMTEILSSTKAGHTDAAVLTAANIADELFKSQEIAENLRAQLKEYLDEASKSKNEISELKREIFKLQNCSPPPGDRRRCAPLCSAEPTPFIWALARSMPAATPKILPKRNSAPPCATAMGGA